MKTIVSIFCLSLFGPTYAQMTPQREQLYHCVSTHPIDNVEGVKIHRSHFGKNSFYEVEVEVLEYGARDSFFKKVHLISKYDGRVLTFGTGNFRVRIDHVFPEEMKYQSFVRIPQYNIHSKEWTCKKS